MFEILFKVWWMIALLPFLIFQEGNKWLTDFLKKRNIYQHWDIWHSLLVLAVVLLIVLLLTGYY